jgi:hypothetical protein
MYLKIFKTIEKKINIEHKGDPMASLIDLVTDGTIYAMYDDFVEQVFAASKGSFDYNYLTFQKNDNVITLYNYLFYGKEEEKNYRLTATTSEIKKITDMVMDLLNKDWQKIYIEFDGNTFNIFVDDKPYT